MGKELRCPRCQRLVPAEALAFSSTLGMFVCAECRSSAPARLPDAPPAAAPPRVPMPPPPSLLDTPLPPPPPPSAPRPASRPRPHMETPAAPSNPARSPLVIGGMLVAVAAIVTIVAILISRSSPPPPTVADEQRAWDQAHSAEIIKLKSQAEALAIDGKLKDAHAKYREIEKIIGGRQVKEPTLFDMVEVARQDQDKVYKLLLSQMEQERAAAAETPPPASEPALPPAPPPAQIAAPTQSYPNSFNALRGQTPIAATMPAPPVATAPIEPPPPATVASTEPTSIPAGAVQFTEIPRGPVSDEQIGEAIQHGVDFLMSNFRDGELRLESAVPETYRQGLEALCVYALASSGRAIIDQRLNSKSPEMIQMLEKLKTYRLTNEGEVQAPLVYARSLRACALATFNRPQDRDVLEDDVDWLINANTDGAYTYDDRFAPPRQAKRANQHRATTQRSSGHGVIESPQAVAVYLAKAPYQGPGQIVDQQRPRRATRGGPTIKPPPPASGPSGSNPAATGSTPPPRKVFTNTLPPRRPSQQPDKYKPPFPWDNSNSQYGLLGVWAGAEVGCEVPDNYWRKVREHWTSCQLPSGEFPYSATDDTGRYSMTVAGIASLLVTHDYLDAPLLTGRIGNGRVPYSRALTAGLSWLEDDNSVEILGEPLFYAGYNLFGIERVGLASGFKQFGLHDWFVELAMKTLPTQYPNGAFGRDDAGTNSIIDTAYVLLFLSRGRHPIMANKLRYDGNWSNRPREIANLTNFTARELERPLNWQVVDIARGPSDWADAPILFMSGQSAVKLSDEERGKLAEFIDNGGILFTHADLGGEQFNKFAMDLSKQLFPRYGPLQDLPPEHPIYKVNYQIGLPRPRLMGVSNGVRLLMLHSPVDLSNAWQVRATASRKEAFHLGANVYLYATGKERFRNRLDTPIIPWPQQMPLREMPLARLSYDGNWDPEPGAWPRMGRKLHCDTGTALEIKPTLIAQLTYEKFHLAHLTGTDAFKPSPADIAAMKRFIESGGTLLIDAAGGSPAFAQAETTWLPEILGNVKLETAKESDPLVKHTTEGTVDMPPKSLRLYALEQLGGDASQRLKVARVGKGRIVFSPLDITSGLLATNTWGILGYLPEYSDALVKNVVMTTAP